MMLSDPDTLPSRRSLARRSPKLWRLGRDVATALFVILTLLSAAPSIADSLLGMREYAGSGERTTILRSGKEETISYRFELALFDNAYFLRFEFGGIVECFGEGPDAAFYYCADRKFAPPLRKGARGDDGIETNILEMVPPLHAWSVNRGRDLVREDLNAVPPMQAFRWRSSSKFEPQYADLETMNGILVRYTHGPNHPASQLAHFSAVATASEDAVSGPVKYTTLATELALDSKTQVVRRRGEVTIEQVRTMDAGESFHDFVAGMSSGALCLESGQRVDYPTGSIVKDETVRQLSMTGEQLVAMAEREMRNEGQAASSPQQAQQGLARKQAMLILGGILLLLAAAVMKLRGGNRAA